MSAGFAQSVGGLLVPRGAQESAAAAALQRHDPDLRLTWSESDVYGTTVYRVIRRVRNEARPFETVCVYMDEAGNPLPLSVTGLLEMVQRLDRNTVGGIADSDAHNARLVAERRKDYDRDSEAIVDEFEDRLDGKFSSPLPRGRSLYLSRIKQRERIKTKEFRP